MGHGIQWQSNFGKKPGSGGFRSGVVVLCTACYLGVVVGARAGVGGEGESADVVLHARRLDFLLSLAAPRHLLVVGVHKLRHNQVSS